MSLKLKHKIKLGNNLNIRSVDHNIEPNEIYF